MRSDAELLMAARSDARAFRALYDRYAERVFAYHRARTRSEDAAHELTAETFAQVWLTRGRFRDECDGSAAPWLFAIARHVLAASVRRRVVEDRARARLGVPAAAVPADETWLDGLDEALLELPAAQREALRLRFEEDLSYDGVAAALGTTPAAARVRVHRGLAALRERLGGAR
jgi:RNA polymerase sigma-70 factor (ECF subfamily)